MCKWQIYLKVLQECLFYAAKIPILPKLMKMLLPEKGKTLLLLQLCPTSEKECILQKHFFVLHSSNIIVANVNLNKQEVFNYKVTTE